ncbi:MAG TPA: zinc-ribbon domain-containing protein [Pyrinomonadaceae bacterium]|nr:zinc-ribbon domain-containing protein [Pyrinomonadaceae bacterium]
MPETITEKATCSKCGADVRDGTTFCYSCGNRVAESLSPDAEDISGNVTIPIPAPNSTIDTLKAGEEDSDKLARAAEQRRKSRVGLRKPKEYTWEPTDDPRFILLATLVIFIIALGVVFVTVFWK